MKTALPFIESSDCSHIVVADDVDILTLLLHHCESKNVFMLRSFGTHTMINIWSLQQALGTAITNNVLFLHASTGCDNTSVTTFHCLVVI